MKPLALLLIALGACSDPGGNPLGGGGPPVPGDDDDDDVPDASVSTDSAPGTPDASVGPDAAFVDAIVGRMCQADSLLAPIACPAGADFTDVIAAHIEVVTSVTQADADGNFELPKGVSGPVVATLRLAPLDANYRASVIPIALRADGTAGPIDLPVMLEEDFLTLANMIGPAPQVGDSTIVIYTVDGATKLSGVTVIGFDPDAVFYYDNGAPLEWDQDVEGTDADGVILVTQLSSLLSPRTITLDDGTRTKQLVNIPIEANSITFITADFSD